MRSEVSELTGYDWFRVKVWRCRAEKLALFHYSTGVIGYVLIKTTQNI